MSVARQNAGDSSGPTALLLMKEERKKQRLSVCTPNPRLRSPLLGNWQGIPVSTKSLSQVSWKVLGLTGSAPGWVQPWYLQPVSFSTGGAVWRELMGTSATLHHWGPRDPVAQELNLSLEVT